MKQGTMQSWRTGLRKPWIRPASVLVTVTSLCALVSCVPSGPMREVKEPRAGRPLNDRVAVVYSKHYEVRAAGLEKLHPHPQKYSHIYLQLVADGLVQPEDVFVPEPVSEEQILLAHAPTYVASLRDSKRVARSMEIPKLGAVPSPVLDAILLNSFRHCAGGTVLAGRLACRYGIGINLAGGYHHAKPDAGEGFCIYNDLAIAIRTLQKEGLIRRALIVDLDVHQGNGSAVFFGPDAGDSDVFTFSMHQADIYPIPKETSDVDVELAAGTGDQEYLRLLAVHLPEVMERARPDIVFLLAGADTLAGDHLAGLRMTAEGLARRDAMVIDRCVQKAIPVVVTLGGGYQKDAWAAQAGSIRRTIGKYGSVRAGQVGPTRGTMLKQQIYGR